MIHPLAKADKTVPAKSVQLSLISRRPVDLPVNDDEESRTRRCTLLMHYSFVQCSLKGTRSELDFDEFNLEFALGLSLSLSPFPLCALQENKINKFFRVSLHIHVLHLSRAFVVQRTPPYHLERPGNYT